MPQQMQINDKTRIALLEALLKKGAVQPNIRQIQKYTGFHKATIKSSLDFLQKEGLIDGFGPKINFRKFGYKLEIKEMLQLDCSQKQTFEKFLDVAKSDPNLYRLSAVIGSGNWNFTASHFYEDVESFHRETQRKYYEAIPNFMAFVRDRQIFYATEPNYKSSSRTESLIKIIKQRRQE